MKNFKKTLALLLAIAIITMGNTFSLNIASNAASEDYKQSLRNMGFPESYVTKLAVIHDLHPSWQFEPLIVSNTNSSFTWSYVTSSENGFGGNSPYNLVTTSSYAPSPWASLGQGNYTPYYDADNTTLYDSGWRKASYAAVCYFMDPRNFLNDTDIFMFETLQYNASYQTAERVNAALAGSFMANANCDNSMSYAQHIWNCGRNFNISPVFLASRLKQEQGTGSSPLVTGTVGDKLYYYATSKPDTDNGSQVWGPVYTKDNVDSKVNVSTLKATYNGYYNFFNIGASGTGRFAIYINGATEAIEGGWTTKAAAISGGAKKVRDKYIGDYQDTIYLQKFNVDGRSSRALWGQYMQNIAAPLTEGRNSRNTYTQSGLLEAAHKFKIPVYSGMPAAPCADPAGGNSYYSPSQNSTPTYTDTLYITAGRGSVAFDDQGTTQVVVSQGQMIYCSVIPANGYKVAEVNIGGTLQTIKNGGAAAVYSFGQPYGSVDIYVKFEPVFNPRDIVFDTQKLVDWVISGGVSEYVAVGLSTDSNTGDVSCVMVSPPTVDPDPQTNINFTNVDTFSADSYKYAIITAKTSASNTNASMFLCAGSTLNATADCRASWNWINDGLWHDYIIDLSSLSLWTGNVNKIRFDFFDGTTPANSVLYLRSLRFTSSNPATPQITANASVYTKGSDIILSYSGLSGYYNTAENIMPFVAIYAEGTRPGVGSALQYTYVNNANGTLSFPDGVTNGTMTGDLPAGRYTAWLAYDACGSNALSINLNNAYFAGNGCSYSFEIVNG